MWYIRSNTWLKCGDDYVNNVYTSYLILPVLPDMAHVIVLCIAIWTCQLISIINTRSSKAWRYMTQRQHCHAGSKEARANKHCGGHHHRNWLIELCDIRWYATFGDPTFICRIPVHCHLIFFIRTIWPRRVIAGGLLVGRCSGSLIIVTWFFFYIRSILP